MDSVPWLKHSDRTRRTTIKKVWASFGFWKYIHDPDITGISISLTLLSGTTKDTKHFSWDTERLYACKSDIYGIGEDGPVQIEQKVWIVV